MDMKLQISFDMTNLDQAIDIAKKVEMYADIFEIGTLLLYRYGIDAVELFRRNFEKKILLADTKIVDRGKDAVALFANRVDWITVMAGTPKDMIHSMGTASQASKINIMLDLLDSNSAGQSAMEAKQMGIEALLVHCPYDEKESMGFLEKWEMIRGNTELPIFLAGKITRDNFKSVVALQPNGIIIGSAIIKANDPVKEAQFFFEQTRS